MLRTEIDLGVAGLGRMMAAMRGCRRRTAFSAVLAVLAALTWALPLTSAVGQSRPLGGADQVAQSAVSPYFGLDDVLPEIHKWYVPRHLPQRRRQPWYIADTQYARERYSRYVSTALEGEAWYDPFGQPVGRGWLLYQWSQEQAHAKGSSIWKDPMYRHFFGSLVIASDGDRYGDYRLMVGDAIHTVFTPLTFNKPRFSGMRLDHATDWYEASLILSRPSMPDQQTVQGQWIPSERRDFTNLVGGHLALGAGAGRLGFTYVNLHHGQTKEELGDGSPIRGTLTTDQNQPLKTLWVRVRDDSPGRGDGGALLFDHDIVLVNTSGREFRGREIGLLPTVEGGAAEGATLEAEGSDFILLTYDLESLNYQGVQTADLRQVAVELTVANDYRLEVASDRQNTGESRRAQPVFITSRRAAGNVQDNSNATLLRVDYGLPTATEVMGVNWDLAGWRGLSLQGEMAMSRRHRQYPNPDIRHRHSVADRGVAGYLQIAYRPYPYEVFGEIFSIADAYSTTGWLTMATGRIMYDEPTRSLYEFVDDDDDLDAVPEWARRSQLSETRAWPGYDQNADQYHDHNQNGNLLPDYEEPFLRFRSDRPEFLPGLDMNHNGTADRYENDDLPDYPYGADRRGANLYGAVEVVPGVKLTLGHQRLRLVRGDGRTRSYYGLARGVLDAAGPARLRLFAYAALVRDDIPDPLRQWLQPVGSPGRMQEVADPLAAQDTWVHTSYADLDHRLGPGVRLQHRLRLDVNWQRDGEAALVDRGGRRRSGFFGLIDRAEWSVPMGLATLEARWKSEYRWRRPYVQRQLTGRAIEEIVALMWRQPLLAEHTSVSYFPRYGRQIFSTELQVGYEVSWFRLLDGELPEADEGYRSRTLVVQLTNRSAYEGYKVVTRAGLQVGRRTFERARTERRNTVFFTIHAGLN